VANAETSAERCAKNSYPIAGRNRTSRLKTFLLAAKKNQALMIQLPLRFAAPQNRHYRDAAYIRKR
jgi:hypothetical protein